MTILRPDDVDQSRSPSFPPENSPLRPSTILGRVSSMRLSTIVSRSPPMSESNLPVTSREYKLMLNPDRFRQVDEGRSAFMDLVRFLIEKKVGGRYMEQEELKAKDVPPTSRITTYLDTPELAFHGHGWILRARDDRTPSTKPGEPEKREASLNLKYRGADRYLSAVQDVASPEGGKPKFEEDILPPFRSNFSRSNTLKSDEPRVVRTVDEAAALFPVLGTLGIAGATRVEIANGFTAQELVLHVGGIDFGDKEPVKMSLSFWYLLESRKDWPMVGEFSFDYDALKAKEKEKKDGEKEEDGDAAPSLEQFPLATVRGTNEFFRALQLQAGWLDLSGTTKSAFALSGV
jgi:hypothetical protein